MKKQQAQIKVDKHGYIQFYIPSQYAQIYFGKKQKYLSFGAKNSPETMAQAYQFLSLLQNDLEKGAFNLLNLDKYKHSDKIKKIDYVRVEELTLLELFDRYVEYYSAFISKTMLKRYYRLYRNSLVSIANINIFTEQGQLKVAQHLMNTRGRETQYKLLGVLKRAINWAKENCLIPDNIPNNFSLHAQRAFKLRPQKRKQITFLQDIMDRQSEYRAWVASERDLIIKTIRERLIENEFYSQIDTKGLLYEFFFYTGIRHEEGFALNWGNVTYNNGLTYIRIDKVYTNHVLLDHTKNYKVRNIPLHKKAADIIEQIRSGYERIGLSTGKDDLVFLNQEGNYLTTGLMSSAWRGEVGRKIGCVTQLVVDGKLPYYIEPYSTRRTFISLELQNGADLKSVADYVGDEPETLLKHYYFGNKDYVPKVDY